MIKLKIQGFELRPDSGNFQQRKCADKLSN